MTQIPLSGFTDKPKWTATLFLWHTECVGFMSWELHLGRSWERRRAIPPNMFSQWSLFLCQPTRTHQELFSSLVLKKQQREKLNNGLWSLPMYDITAATTAWHIITHHTVYYRHPTYWSAVYFGMQLITHRLSQQVSLFSFRGMKWQSNGVTFN